MSTVVKPMYGWNTIRWRKVERRVFKLQTRIYQASSRGDGFVKERCGKWIT